MQILFLGAPGAGKGTQCKRLSSHLKLAHLSSGDLLRQAVTAGTPAGVKAKQYMDKGQLVPDDVLISMFAEKLKTPACAVGFILDGFPRNLAQAQALDTLLTDIKKQLSVVINLNVDEALLTERIVGRRSCSNKECSTPYHVKFAPPKQQDVCDHCHSPLTQRSDDKEELVAQRLKTYLDQTAPLISYYNQRGLLCTVEGNGTPDEIFSKLLKCLKVPA